MILMHITSVEEPEAISNLTIIFRIIGILVVDATCIGSS